MFCGSNIAVTTEPGGATAGSFGAHEAATAARMRMGSFVVLTALTA
jgi:hypothetical protein